jgi:hypothetical protein
MTDARLEALIMDLREALLIALAAMERYLGMPRSKEPRHKRE